MSPGELPFLALMSLWDLNFVLVEITHDYGVSSALTLDWDFILVSLYLLSETHLSEHRLSGITRILVSIFPSTA